MPADVYETMFSSFKSVSLRFWRLWCTIKLYYIGVVSLLKQLLQRHKDSRDVLPENLNGQVVIVTGGGSGIGLEVTRALVKRNATVIIASPNISTVNEVVHKLKSTNLEANVDSIYLDLSSLQSVKDFVEEFNKKYSKLNILINNAGIMLPPFALTQDGFEQQIGTNYLGHFLLTHLLLPKLELTGSKVRCARIVNVSSSTHLVGDSAVQSWFSSKQEDFCSHIAYANSKLAIILSTYQLNRQLKGDHPGVTVNCLHPGVINTNLYQNIHWTIKWLFDVMGRLIFLTPYEGADTVLYAALSPQLEHHGGLYLDNSASAISSPHSYSLTLQQQLWDTSLKALTGFLIK